jgi:hypothetical protein
MKFARLAVVISVVLLGVPAVGQKVLNAKLAGLRETPIVVTEGRGTARLVISNDEKSINYELTYSGLEGNTVPTGQVLLLMCTSGGTPSQVASLYSSAVAAIRRSRKQRARCLEP